MAASESSPISNRERLTAAGCEVLVCPGATQAARLEWLLDELGRRRVTNVLVEGGGQLLGSFLELGQIDEVHAFIAPKIVGGQGAASPIGGLGIDAMAKALALREPVVECSGSDAYVHGRVARS